VRLTNTVFTDRHPPPLPPYFTKKPSSPPIIHTFSHQNVGLKFIPRIDLNPRAEVDGRKRKKGATGAANMRPPQRFFNYEVKVRGRKQVSKRNQVYVFQNDTYKDGLVEKDFKLSALVLENVNPTLDEITKTMSTFLSLPKPLAKPPSLYCTWRPC
jgi:hypothetical protein